MTAIAGLVHDGRVYIGGDSFSGNGASQDTVTNPKVIEIGTPPYGLGPMLIGFTSSWRMGQLLQHKLTLPDVIHATDPLEYLVCHFVESVRKTLKDGGYAEVSNGQESGGYFLVGYGGRLFTIQADYSVLESTLGIDATGAGYKEVLASLYALRDSRIKPEDRITTALEAAATFNPMVQGPFLVRSAGVDKQAA